MIDVTGQPLNLAAWTELIDAALAGGVNEPIVNLADGGVAAYDAVFIGGGAGGRFGAAYLAALGGRALIVDRWPFLGGSCPHQACVPHHLFSDAAAELDLARWMSGQLWFPEWDPARASILELIELFRAGRSGAHAFMNWQTKEQLGVDFVLNAPARALDRRTVAVPALGRTFETENIVLALGASPAAPDVPGVELPGVFDYASLVEELEYEPQRCLIIGGGKTALEYGSFFQATGCETTVVTRSPLMRTSSMHHVDEDLRRYVEDGVRRRGVNVLAGAQAMEITGRKAVESVIVQQPSGARVELNTDFVFLATGERPNATPAAEWLGVDRGAQGEVAVDGRMRTSVPGVYAVGDLVGAPMEMFKARRCGATAARNIAGDPAEFDFSCYPDFLHTTYEVTWVGLSEAEARERYDHVVVLQMPPRADGLDTDHLPLPCADRSMLFAFAQPELSGYQKAIVDADSRRILGLHHVGYGAKDAFQYLDYLLRRPQGLTVDEMGEMNELFLNPEHFIQLSRLRAGRSNLTNL